MREVVGFAAGLIAGAVAAAAVSSEAGRRMRDRLVTEAEPEVRDALAEWDPLIREVARAVRLGVREVETTAERIGAYLTSLAEEGVVSAPAEGSGSEPADGPGGEPPAGAMSGEVTASEDQPPTPGVEPERGESA